MDAIIVAIPDLHYLYHDPRFISLTNKIIELTQPSHVVQGGDALDAGGISSYLQLVGKESRLFQEIESYNKQLDIWQRLMKKGSTFHQLQGNHEERLERYIAKNCRDIHELVKPLPELLRLKERSKEDRGRVNFKWHKLDQWDSCKIGDVYLHHGVYFDKHVAVNNLSRYDVKLVQFHAHRFSYASNGKIWSACLGHGSNAKKTMHIHAPSTWQQVIGVVTVINGSGSLEPILVNNGEAVFRGKKIKA